MVNQRSSSCNASSDSLAQLLKTLMMMQQNHLASLTFSYQELVYTRVDGTVIKTGCPCGHFNFLDASPRFTHADERGQTAKLGVTVRRKTWHQSQKISDESIKTELVFELRSANLAAITTSILESSARRTSCRHVLQLLLCGALGAKKRRKFGHNLPIKRESDSSIGKQGGPLAGLDHSTLSEIHYVAIVLVVKNSCQLDKLFLSLTLHDSVASSLNFGSMMTVS